jgi:tyrosine ammonia-lyase
MEDGAMPRDDAATTAIFELDDRIDLATANAVAEGTRRLAVSPAAAARCARAHDRLGRLIAEGRHVYGLTTGFGPLANRLVGPGNGVALQQNLIHHLASGLGPPLSWATARAVVLARLVSIARGVSGASGESVRALEMLLASDLAPWLPSRGTVGASGDLTPLAHLVLCLQGRGRFITRGGETLDGTAGLVRLGLTPLSLEARDGLALVNGTSAMTGIAVRNAQAAGRAGAWALALTAAMGECLGARAEAWHPELARVRPHPGQVRAAAELARRIAGSARLEVRPIALRRLGIVHLETEDHPGQDAYTLRCAPQVVGAFLDQAAWHDGVVEIELNAVTDNPILPEDFDPPALHGGNFMGQHVALASDALSTGVSVLAGLAERQVARLTDERLNQGLPAFLHGGEAGLNSGFMGAQVTATALVAEMRATGPASVHSLSTNGANQDVVSLGTIAARLTEAKLRTLSEVQAILALCVAQAMEHRGGPECRGFSPAAQALHRMVRKISPPLSADRPLAEEIAAMTDAIAAATPP